MCGQIEIMNIGGTVVPGAIIDVAEDDFVPVCVPSLFSLWDMIRVSRGAFPEVW